MHHGMLTESLHRKHCMSIMAQTMVLTWWSHTCTYAACGGPYHEDPGYMSHENHCVEVTTHDWDFNGQQGMPGTLIDHGTGYCLTALPEPWLGMLGMEVSLTWLLVLTCIYTSCAIKIILLACTLAQYQHLMPCQSTIQRVHRNISLIIFAFWMCKNGSV